MKLHQPVDEPVALTQALRDPSKLQQAHFRGMFRRSFGDGRHRALDECALRRARPACDVACRLPFGLARRKADNNPWRYYLRPLLSTAWSDSSTRMPNASFAGIVCADCRSISIAGLACGSSELSRRAICRTFGYHRLIAWKLSAETGRASTASASTTSGGSAFAGPSKAR